MLFYPNNATNIWNFQSKIQFNRNQTNQSTLAKSQRFTNVIQPPNFPDLFDYNYLHQYQKIMNVVKKMDFKFETLIELIRTFPDEETCIKYLEDIIWEGKPVSPFDPSSKVY